jgi:hypothetical protein
MRIEDGGVDGKPVSRFQGMRPWRSFVAQVLVAAKDWHEQ